MAFERTRIINGNAYRYREERWREGGKVRSKSKCLGRVDGGQRKKNKVVAFVEANFRHEPGTRAMEEWEEKSNAAVKRAAQEKAEAVKAPAEETKQTASEPSAPPSEAPTPSETSKT